MNRLLCLAGVLSLALAGCSAGSVPSKAPQDSKKHISCLVPLSAGRNAKSTQRNALCSYGGGAAINDFSSTVGTPGTQPIDLYANMGGTAQVEVYQPDGASYSTVTMTYPGQVPVTDTVDMRSTQGAGSSIRDGVIGWLVGHLADWALTHDVWGQDLGQVILAVPNSSALNGGQWVPVPIRVGPNGLPPGWAPASQNTGNPNIPPTVPPQPGGCGGDFIGWDCRNVL